MKNYITAIDPVDNAMLILMSIYAYELNGVIMIIKT